MTHVLTALMLGGLITASALDEAPTISGTAPIVVLTSASMAQAAQMLSEHLRALAPTPSEAADIDQINLKLLRAETVLSLMRGNASEVDAQKLTAAMDDYKLATAMLAAVPRDTRKKFAEIYRGLDLRARRVSEALLSRADTHSASVAATPLAPNR